jgi:transcriptional regulator with XRE-family HTH domain
MLNYKIIGSKIREFRLRKYLSQEKLAEMCDLSASYVSYVETAKKKVSLESLVKLGNALGVTADVFLTEFQKNIAISLLDDCTDFEKQVIFDAAIAIKKSLRQKIGLTSGQVF